MIGGIDVDVEQEIVRIVTVQAEHTRKLDGLKDHLFGPPGGSGGLKDAVLKLDHTMRLVVWLMAAIGSVVIADVMQRVLGG